MLQNIQDYVNMAPNGISILSETVCRRFPADDSWVAWDDPRAYAYTSTLAEIIQEIFQRHASGISFREHNAGPNLDMQMKDAGFDIDIYVDWKTGFIFGGSEYNCGTWMDKMGESEKAGTKGIPGTPRDGAPAEIVGLVKSTLRWLDGLVKEGDFPFKGVIASSKWFPFAVIRMDFADGEKQSTGGTGSSRMASGAILSRCHLSATFTSLWVMNSTVVPIILANACHRSFR